MELLHFYLFSITTLKKLPSIEELTSFNSPSIPFETESSSKCFVFVDKQV